MLLNEMKKPINVRRVNKIMESRFGFAIDFKNLTFKKAIALAQGITEGLDAIKRTHSIHTAEKDPQYMEMLMVRESLHRWMIANEKRLITESELAKSEAILAAKDMVDSLQDMLEKVGKMQNEQMPALLDAIRDQIGGDKADSFKTSMAGVLNNLYEALTSGREGADQAARALAGEQVATPMDMGMGGKAPVPAGGAGLGTAPVGEPGPDEFGATDAAAGGEEELGRERR